MLNLVRALNLSVRLTSTGLALKVRLHFRSMYKPPFTFFFLKMDKNRLFQEGPDLKQKKKLLVKLLPLKESLE